MTKISSTVTVERNGVEIDLSVKGEFYPEVEGRLNGPPEDCYPGEDANAEILEVLFEGKIWDGTLTPAEEKLAINNLISDAQDW